MPSVIIDTDIQINIFSTSEIRAIGLSSIYVENPHPGSAKKIKGWEWDKRTWPSEAEIEAVGLAPSLWDPLASGIDKALFQSGYGDNKDLLLLDILPLETSGITQWAPKINHGFFYTQTDEWWLYSDSYVTQFFSLSGVEAGSQTLQLDFTPKPSIPVTVRQYQFDFADARHVPDLEFRKLIDFSNSGISPEFKIDDSFLPPKIILNGNYSEAVGMQMPPLSSSGTADPADIAQLEQVGQSDGTGDQRFQLEFSPIDTDGVVEIWTWTNPAIPTLWTNIDPLDTSHEGTDDKVVKIDYDLGTVQFGDFDPLNPLTTGGKIPSPGHKVGAYYTKSVAVHYEPEHTVDYILAANQESSTNPVTSASKGFVQVSTQSLEPASIELTSTLPQINPFLIQLGNNIGELIATVKSAGGVPIENQEVTFNILTPIVGTLGGTAVETSAITDPNGEARVFYNAPVTVQDMGNVTIDVTAGGGETVMDIDGLVDPGTVSGIYLYKIHKYDEALGLPVSGEDSYYTTFLADEDIIAGSTANKTYEQTHRTANDLQTPPFYPATDIETGKKSIILTTKTNVMNPKTGVLDPSALSPLFPKEILDVGTPAAPVLRLTYDGLLEDPGTGDTKSYFAIGDAQTSLQASTVNNKTNATITSNEIQMLVTLPDTVNGTFFCNVLNDIPQGLLTKVKNMDTIPEASIAATSAVENFNDLYLDERLYLIDEAEFEPYTEWFRRTRRGDTVAMTIAQLDLLDPELSGLEIIQPIDCPSEIPLGFRLKSFGITAASLLDQITYLDPNDHLPEGYFEVQSNSETLGHKFDVSSII